MTEEQPLLPTTDKLLFQTPAQFSMYIEEIVHDYDSYLECLLAFCEDKIVDYEDVAKLLTEPLKHKIFLEAQQQYSMPKPTTNELDL